MASNERTRFRKGQSGNPGGKTKAQLEVQAMIRAHESDVPGLMRELVRLARKSPDDKVRIAAIREALDRIVGKPLQAVAVSNDGGKPFRHAHGIDLEALPLEALDKIRPALALIEATIAGAVPLVAPTKTADE